MRVLVCGGRGFDDETALINLLGQYADQYGPFTHIIHGGANGADALAGVWAQLRQLPVTVYRANWQKHGKAAGPIRNRRMLDEGKPDLVIAFPGGKGTANMIAIANSSGVRVIDVAREPWP